MPEAEKESSMGELNGEHPIRLVILDPFGLYRVSLGRLLSAQAGFEVVGECATGEEALSVIARSAVDLILLDFDSFTAVGGDFMAAARAGGYQGRFLIIAGSIDVRKSAMAVKCGASGIFLKSESPDRLLHAIRMVAGGEVWVDQKVLQLLADGLIDRELSAEEPVRAGTLNERERSVLSGIVRGLSNRKIADDMTLSESSVKNVVQRLFGKAGVKTRSQLVRAALEGTLGSRDLLDLPQEHGDSDARKTTEIVSVGAVDRQSRE